MKENSNTWKLEITFLLCWGILARRCFCTDLTAFGPYKQQQANILQYGSSKLGYYMTRGP